MNPHDLKVAVRLDPMNVEAVALYVEHAIMQETP